MKRMGGLVLSIIILLAVVLAGCGTGKEKSAGETASPSASEAETSQPKDTPDSGKGDGDGVYDPPIEVTTGKYIYGFPIYGEGEDMNNNSWTQYLKENLGIQVKTLWEVPMDDLEQKTNLMIASRDLPDFFLVTDAQLAQLNKAGMIEDLTDVYREHAPDNVRLFIEQAGQEVMDAATFNGKLMALPFTGVSKENAPMVWVREDWMKKLNLPEPKTMDDLLAISEAFTTQDPDDNGKNDTFGLGVDMNLEYVSGFMNGFHAYRDIWVQDQNGGLVYGSIQPEMKTVLGKLQDMYKTGQIDKEFGVKNTGKVNESISNNKIGMYYNTLPAGIGLSLSQDPEKENTRWIPYPAPSIDASPTLLQHDRNTFHGFWVVKKGVKHPEAMLKLADAWIKLFYLNMSDDIFKKYNFGDDVSHWMNAPIKMFKSYKNAEISVHLEPLLKSDTKATAAQLAELIPEERDEYDKILKYRNGDFSQWGWASRSDIGGSGSIVMGYVKNNQFKPNQFLGSSTPAMVQKNATLAKMELEVFTKIILGDSLDRFDTFVKDWNKLGGDQMTKEVNDWYKNK
ncbi:extracellular solute-binding protein [Paenibacillus eucommiae]|uniref:Aldouronate transport system substrate-binding protein n=1 Tax=Paenibacillus eucommiae TaxID=1355755 RepID=A0ABS4IVG3_9BACL|nr:extracellular solute-binding protein [Paenibacillus eucommiae]MBP1991075.1 putative aldouronate transport system substrate-binding protein [Paenibacillus eucommiae]